MTDSVSTRVMVRGAGSRVFDSDGNDYIDAAAGTFNMSLGYGHPVISAAISQQHRELIHMTGKFRTPSTDALTTRLQALAPDELTEVHLKSCSGSTANEGAIRLAQAITGREGVISLHRSHHGQSIYASAISGDSRRRAHSGVAVGAENICVPDPYCLRCFYGQTNPECQLLCVSSIRQLVELGGPGLGNIACLILEPISGSGGNIVPPPGYLQALREFCDEFGILLIFDEIQTGVGRTGNMFAAQTFDVTPDILTIGKGLGAGMPIAAILSKESLSRHQLEHSFTFGRNILASAVALAALDEISQPGFLATVRERGRRISHGLQGLATKHSEILDVRGVGLMLAVEVVAANGGAPNDSLAQQIVDSSMEHGLLLRRSGNGAGNVIKIRPPLNISESETESLVNRLSSSFSDALAT